MNFGTETFNLEVELRKLSPGAEYFDSCIRSVARDCFLSRKEAIR